MLCVFFGHRDAPSAVREALRCEIVNLIETEGVREFIVGNNGNFDFLVQEVLKEITEEKPYVSCAVMLSRIDERALCGDQRMTVFPEGLEHTPPRFAIARRNELMLKNASHVIAYVKHTPSDSAKWVQRAEKNGLRVINLAK